MTYRERREARAERLREWAAKREDKAAALRAVGGDLRHDWAFITQPGHIPERARMNARDDRAREHDKKAASMVSRADGIESQFDRAIYSDDPDAIDALREKIILLCGKRDKMKASNAAFRKGDPAWAAHLGVTVEKAAELRTVLMAPNQWHHQPHPPYELTNLGATIRQAEKRIVEVERRAKEAQAAQDAPGGVVVKTFEGQAAEYCEVIFAEKPEREVINALKAAGFYWGAGKWSGKLASLPAEIMPVLVQVQA